LIMLECYDITWDEHNWNCQKKKESLNCRC
jgi:hypothetical protein